MSISDLTDRTPRPMLLAPLNRGLKKIVRISNVSTARRSELTPDSIGSRKRELNNIIHAEAVVLTDQVI